MAGDWNVLAFYTMYVIDIDFIHAVQRKPNWLHYESAIIGPGWVMGYPFPYNVSIMYLSEIEDSEYWMHAEWKRWSKWENLWFRFKLIYKF